MFKRFGNISSFSRDVKLYLVFNLLANMGVAVFLLIFNLYLKELGLREDYIGVFNGVQTVVMAFAGIGLGRVVGRFGMWGSITGGVTLLFASSFLLAVIENPTVIVALSGFYGLGLSFLYTMPMPFIVEFVPREQRNQVAAVAVSVIAISTTFGSLAGGLMPEFFQGLLEQGGDIGIAGYRWTLIVGSAVAVLGIVPMLMMGDVRRNTRAQQLARAPIAEAPAEVRQSEKDMWIFVISAVLVAVGMGMVIPFYNVFLEDLGADAAEIGYIFAAANFVAAVVGLASPIISRRMGALRGIILIRAIMLPPFLLLAFIPGYGLAIFAHIMRAIGMNLAWPVDSTFLGEVLPARLTSTAFGRRSAAWNTGSAIAAFVGGWLIVHHGYAPTFVIFVVFTALSSVVFSGYFWRHPRVKNGFVVSHRVEPEVVAPESAAS
jgi:MFS family permease